MAERIIVLHSGGLDSTVCLLLALEKEFDVLSLGIDYRQRSQIELEYADKICSRFNVSRKVLHVEWDKPERDIPRGRSVDKIRGEISPAFLPGRNAIFLSLACAEASGIGASQVWIGVNSIDYSGYPDCRQEFIDEFNKMINLAIPNAARIIAPIMHMSKPEIAQEARRFGLKQDDTWSCYRPITKLNLNIPCGQCDGCVLNKYAWAKALIAENEQNYGKDMSRCMRQP